MGEWAISQVSGVDTAQRERLALSSLFPATGPLKSRSGVLAGLGCSLTTGMSVKLGAGRCWVQGGSAGDQGGYFGVLDADKTLTFDDGSASPRVDLIVARAYENAADSSGSTKFAFEIFKGTPGAGTPAAPPSSIVLHEKTIAAGLSAGTGGLGTAPTDRRVRLVAAGGIIPVLSAADRDTLDKYPGLTVFRIDTGARQTWNGTAWTMSEQRGKVSVTPVANTPTFADVVFPIPFDAPPIVTTSAITAFPGTRVTECTPSDITSTGFRAYVTRTDTTPTVIGWTAAPATT